MKGGTNAWIARILTSALVVMDQYGTNTPSRIFGKEERGKGQRVQGHQGIIRYD